MGTPDSVLFTTPSPLPPPQPLNSQPTASPSQPRTCNGAADGSGGAASGECKAHARIAKVDQVGEGDSFVAGDAHTSRKDCGDRPTACLDHLQRHPAGDLELV